MNRPCAAVLSLFVFSLACDEVEHVVTDRGQICINREQVLEFRQTGELELYVRMDCEVECLANERASCEAVIDGPFIRIDSQFTWEDSPDGNCAEKCEQLAATCVVPSTFPGTYTLVHGAEQFPLSLPSNPLIDCLSPMPPEDG